MNKYRGYAKIFIVVVIAFIFAFDVWLFVQGGQDATVSSVIITDWAYNYPAFVFGIGFIMGHLFWPLSRNKYKGIQ